MDREGGVSQTKWYGTYHADLTIMKITKSHFTLKMEMNQICTEMNLVMYTSIPINFGFEKFVRTYVHRTSTREPRINFAFQASARFGGKSHGHQDFQREKLNNNKAESFLPLNFNGNIDVNNREELERDQTRGQQEKMSGSDEKRNEQQFFHKTCIKVQLTPQFFFR